MPLGSGGVSEVSRLVRVRLVFSVISRVADVRLRVFPGAFEIVPGVDSTNSGKDFNLTRNFAPNFLRQVLRTKSKGGLSFAITYNINFNSNPRKKVNF